MIFLLLLAFGFAFWELKLYAEQRGWMELSFGLGSFVSGIGLIVYGINRKRLNPE